MQRPVGNGPYRWTRREAGRSLELSANPGFFLGRPGIGRILVLLARDPEAQLNLLLDGTADVLENVSPASNVPRLASRPDLRVVPVPTFKVGYLLFNQRGYGDRSAAHPILADPEVRRALAMALDRDALVRATFGDFSAVAEGPVAQLHWIRDPGDPTEGRGENVFGHSRPARIEESKRPFIGARIDGHVGMKSRNSATIGANVNELA